MLNRLILTKSIVMTLMCSEQFRKLCIKRGKKKKKKTKEKKKKSTHTCTLRARKRAKKAKREGILCFDNGPKVFEHNASNNFTHCDHTEITRNHETADYRFGNLSYATQCAWNVKHCKWHFGNEVSGNFWDEHATTKKKTAPKYLSCVREFNEKLKYFNKISQRANSVAKLLSVENEIYCSFNSE